MSGPESDTPMKNPVRDRIVEPDAVAAADGAAMNGNGSAHSSPKAEARDVDENIFLFLPNLIGSSKQP
jgi:hypothetical protein